MVRKKVEDDTYIEGLASALRRIISVVRECGIPLKSVEVRETVSETCFRIELDHAAGITKSDGSI